MPVFLFQDAHFTELEQTSFEQQQIFERTHLQAALRDQIDVICPDCLVISEEFHEWADSRRRIDLLAVDKKANLVVIELKRTETGEHMELQAIRYAAMVSTLTFEKAVEILGKYLQHRGIDEDPEEKLLDFLDWDGPQEEAFATGVRITLASADFSRELTTAVLWLNDQGINIRCVRLVPYNHGQQTFVDVQQIIPLPEAEDYQVRLRNQSNERKAVRQSQRDYTRYQFNGATYNKKQLVLAVVTDWFGSHNPESPRDLFEAFPQEIRRGKRGLFETLKEAQRVRDEGDGTARHFMEAGEVFEFPGADTYALYNQWGVGSNLDNFLARARSLEFLIEEVRR